MIDYLLHYLARIQPCSTSVYLIPRKTVKQMKTLGAICPLDSVHNTVPINAHHFSIRIIRTIRPWQHGTDLAGLTARSNVRLHLLPLECKVVVRRRSLLHISYGDLAFYPPLEDEVLLSRARLNNLRIINCH